MLVGLSDRLIMLQQGLFFFVRRFLNSSNPPLNFSICFGKSRTTFAMYKSPFLRKVREFSICTVKPLPDCTCSGIPCLVNIDLIALMTSLDFVVICIAATSEGSQSLSAWRVLWLRFARDGQVGCHNKRFRLVVPLKGANSALLQQILDFQAESWPPNKLSGQLTAFSDSLMFSMDLIHYHRTRRKRDYDPG